MRHFAASLLTLGQQARGCLFLGLVIAVGCGFSISGSSSAHKVSLTGGTMGTSFSIKCWSTSDSAQSGSLYADVTALLEEINQQMSTYLDSSELSRFNAAPAGEWFAVSAETANVTQQALDFHAATNSASDVTVGPMVELWDFGPSKQPLGTKLKHPSADVLEATRAKVGCQHLEVRRQPPSLRKAVDGLQVDLSSIAKGYAVDAVAQLVQDHGFDDFMVEIGGEVSARGTRQDGKPWRIGVEVPDVEQRAIHRVLSLKNKALATSGDYRNFREIDGERVSHVIDPRTGRPLPYRGWSVTLLADTCLEADALATALLVMGEAAGYDWCEENNVAALFVLRHDEEIVERATPAFLEIHPLNQPALAR